MNPPAPLIDKQDPRLELAPLAKVFKLDAPRGGFVLHTPTSSSTIYGHDEIIADLFRLLPAVSKTDLEAQLSLRHDADKVHNLLRALADRGILRTPSSNESTPKDELALALAGFNADPTSADAPDLELALLGRGMVFETLMELADRAGIRASTAISDRTSIVAAACDQPDFEFFSRCNLEAAPAKPIIVFGYADRVEANIFSARIGGTACFECLFHRLRSSRRFVPEFDAGHAGSRLVLAGPAPPPRILSFLLAGAMLAQILSSQMRAEASPHEAKFRSFSAFSGELTAVPIWKLPRCSVCGNANLTKPMPGAFFLQEPARADPH
jgi:hypothetical protein